MKKYEKEVGLYKFPDDISHYKHKRLSLEYCRRVLNKNGGNYTDEEVAKIREFIEIMASLDYRFFKEQVLNWPPEKQIKALEDRLKGTEDPEVIRQINELIEKIKAGTIDTPENPQNGLP